MLQGFARQYKTSIRVEQGYPGPADQLAHYKELQHVDARYTGLLQNAVPDHGSIELVTPSQKQCCHFVYTAADGLIIIALCLSPFLAQHILHLHFLWCSSLWSAAVLLLVLLCHFLP